jgi:predicted enzyme related to lactoylglutathione lyase
MARESAPMTGLIVWHDLIARDAVVARAFYAGLFGWELEGGILIEAGPHTIGRILHDPAAPRSLWVPFVTVDDVDAAAARAAARGGVVTVPGTDIPHVGRFAEIADPTGARLRLWRDASGRPSPVPGPGEGTVAWNELLTTDPPAMAEWHAALFGWTAQRMDVPGDPNGYTMLMNAGVPAAGVLMRPMPPDAPHPPHWLAYFSTADVDARAVVAKSLGAHEWIAPRDIPGAGRIAVLTDPLGATFGLYRKAGA